MQDLISLAYLVAAILFIVGLKGLAHPRTAVRGNLFGASGMLLAIVATLLNQGIVDWITILIGIVVGGIVGMILAVKIQMTAMPQMVALLNGFGGAASALVASAELLNYARAGEEPTGVVPLAVVLGVLIGGLTFTGSLIAFAKLQELIGGAPFVYRGQQFVNGLLGLAAIGLAVAVIASPLELTPFYGVVGLALLLGVLLVLSFGVDYSIFLLETRHRDEGTAATLLGIGIACTTTVLAFGLLAMSSYPALRALGLTTGLGALLSLLLAPTAPIFGGRGEDGR